MRQSSERSQEQKCENLSASISVNLMMSMITQFIREHNRRSFFDSQLEMLQYPSFYPFINVVIIQSNGNDIFVQSLFMEIPQIIILFLAIIELIILCFHDHSQRNTAQI